MWLPKWFKKNLIYKVENTFSFCLVIFNFSSRQQREITQLFAILTYIYAPFYCSFAKSQVEFRLGIFHENCERKRICLFLEYSICAVQHPNGSIGSAILRTLRNGWLGDLDQQCPPIQKRHHPPWPRIPLGKNGVRHVRSRNSERCVDVFLKERRKRRDQALSIRMKLLRVVWHCS